MQKDIREGHAITVEKVLNWINQDGSVEGVSVCDAGEHRLLMTNAVAIADASEGPGLWRAQHERLRRRSAYAVHAALRIVAFCGR